MLFVVASNLGDGGGRRGYPGDGHGHAAGWGERDSVESEAATCRPLWPGVNARLRR